MAFSFNFASDDIEYDSAEETFNAGVERLSIHDQAEADAPLIEAHALDLNDVLTTLPSQLSYNLLSIPSSLSASTRPSQTDAPEDGHEHTTVALPRRDIYDIKAQLMAEADVSSPADGKTKEEDEEALIQGLEKGDLNPRVYEGGFKTWECAVDLAKVLLKGREGGEELVDTILGGEEDARVVELGAGTAMPSLALLHASFSTPVPSTPPKRTVRFVLADYNTTVLRLVTLPNIILTWHHCRQEREREVVATTEAQVQQDGEDEDAEEVAPRKKDEELELDIDESVLSSFQDELKARNLQLHFIAGAWSPEFNDLAVPISPESEEKEALLLLASETIYSPASLRPFSETLISLFSRRSSSAKALIAAKKVYFGVGGGVDEFVSVLEKLEEEKGQKVSVENKQDVEDAGVGRVILQAQLVR